MVHDTSPGYVPTTVQGAPQHAPQGALVVSQGAALVHTGGLAGCEAVASRVSHPPHTPPYPGLAHVRALRSLLQSCVIDLAAGPSVPPGRLGLRRDGAIGSD